MLIDWFTVGAEIVNFLVLVWLLKRYLFRPILNAIDARERDIAARRESAAKEQASAREALESVRRDRENLERHRMMALADAREEAKAERTRLLAEAAQEAENRRATRLQELKDELSDHRAELARLVQREIIDGTRKLVRELASAELEEAVTAAFLRRMRKLQSQENGPPSNSAKMHTPARIRTSFPLTTVQQEQICAEMKTSFHQEGPLNFETDPKLILGIDLITGDERLSWNAATYLESFEGALASLVEAKAGKAGK